MEQREHRTTTQDSIHCADMTGKVRMHLYECPAA